MTYLITLLLIGLTTLLLGNITQSTYGKITFSVSNRWKENRSIVNVLNWMNRHFKAIAEDRIKPKLSEEAKSGSKQEKAEKRHKGFGVLRIVHFLLGNSFANMIELWNPKDESKNRLLGKRHVAKLNKGRETDFKKGGLSPFQLTQIAYGIATEIIENKGNSFGEIVEHENSDNITLRTPEGIINLEQYRKGEANEATNNFVKLLLKTAESYNEPKDKKWQKRQSESKEESTETREQVDSQFTVEDYLEGEFSPNDTENVDLLEQFKEDERVTGQKQGALTRRINDLS